MNLKITRVTEIWQLAGAYYVRAESTINSSVGSLKIDFEEDRPDASYILALDGERPIGTCRVRFYPEDGYGKIERVVVSEAYRGCKVGSQMIKAAETWIAEEGYQKIVISSRDGAVGFYQKLGYTADFRRTHQGKVYLNVYMEKVL